MTGTGKARHQLDEAQVVGRWVHAFEEDEPGRRVFRPDTWAFPPSRRPRTGFEIEAGGRAVRRRPGEADRRGADEGSWSLEPGGRLRLRFDEAGEELLQIESLGAERLVVRV